MRGLWRSLILTAFCVSLAANVAVAAERWQEQTLQSVALAVSKYPKVPYKLRPFATVTSVAMPSNDRLLLDITLENKDAVNFDRPGEIEKYLDSEVLRRCSLPLLRHELDAGLVTTFTYRYKERAEALTVSKDSCFEQVQAVHRKRTVCAAANCRFSDEFAILQPRFPRDAMYQKRGGRCSVTVSVDRDGKPVSSFISLSSGSKDMDFECLNAAHYSRIDMRRAAPRKTRQMRLDYEFIPGTATPPAVSAGTIKVRVSPAK